MITDIIGAHTAQIDGKFNVIKVELLAIKEQTIKTNGRVTRHDEELKAINKSEDMHVINCPHNKPVADFVAIRRYWRPIAIGGIALGFLAVIGGITTYSNFGKLFEKNIVTDQKIERVTENVSENTAGVSEVKKAGNQQGVENAFEYSKKEK